MRKLMMLFFCFGVVYVAQPLWAQSGETEGQDVRSLGEIEIQVEEPVKARLLENKLSSDLGEYGQRVQIIDGQTLVDSGYPTLYQALSKLVPGLYFPTNTHSAQIMGDTQMRMNGSTDFLVLLDGVRLNNRLFGRTSSPDVIGVHIVDHVEILSGGEGLFYGTDATGGVINVVTKAATEKKGGSVRLSYGSYNNKDASAYVTGGAGGHKFLIYGHMEDFDGYPIVDDEKVWQNAAFAVPAMLHPIGGREWSQKRYNFGFKYSKEFDLHRPSSGALDFGFFKNDREILTPSPCLNSGKVTPLPSDCSVYDEYVFYETISFLKWSQDITDQYNFSIKFYYHEQWAEQTALRANGVYSAQNTEYGFEDWGIHLMNSFTFEQGTKILFGVEYQNYWGKDDLMRTPATPHEEIVAIYASLRPHFDFWPGWKTSMGLRYTYNKDAKSTIWNVTSKMPFFNDTMYFSSRVGTSFKLPTTSQLFAIPGVPTPTSRTEGNPGLKPQKSMYVNLGLGGKWLYGGFDAYAFWETITDNIRTVTGSGIPMPSVGGNANKYQNMDEKTRQRGYTFNGHLGPYSGLTLSGSITKQVRIVDGKKAEYENLFPEYFGNVNLRWDGNIGDWKTGIGLVNTYTGKMKYEWAAASATASRPASPRAVRSYGDYWISDLNFHVKPNEQLTVSLELSNIFNKQTIYNYQTSRVHLGRVLPIPGGPLDGLQSSDGYYYFGYRNAPFTATLSVTYDF
ncbi:MAG: TonB-dependent receptor [Deltaproteobacteria bacterium]|jgi:vitamin B12 transporter|nr:TonB-dependent receptor [Deltaproteobacteria bacterium]